MGLGKSQSVDFNAQIADTTIVMIQHIFLSIKNAIEKYETLGKLFEGTKAECLETKLHDRLDTTFQNVPLYPVKRGLQFRFKMCQKKVLNF